MRFLAATIVLIGSIVGPPAWPVAALSLSELGPARESLPSAFSPVFATFRLAASAYKAPSADTVTPPPAAATVTTTPASTTTSTTTPATPAAATTLPATTPAATSETGSSGGEPAATPTAEGTAAATAPIVPDPNAYKPPSVEIAPGGIMIYRGSGSP